MPTIVTLPTIDKYQDALQHPEVRFADPRLRRCKVELDQWGIPFPRSGGFALTYHLFDANNNNWAVRCFHKSEPERETRYKKIVSYLSSNRSPILTSVEYLPSELLIGGNKYPVILMDWIRGDTLDKYIYRNSRNLGEIKYLSNEFSRMVLELERLHIAHGDLSHLNIMIQDGVGA